MWNWGSTSWKTKEEYEDVQLEKDFLRVPNVSFGGMYPSFWRQVKNFHVSEPLLILGDYILPITC